MLVKDIIKICAEFLELKSVVDGIENEDKITDEFNEEKRLFLLAVNMVNSSIASSYIELINTIEILPDINNKVYYKNLDEKGVIEIKKVVTLSGEKLEYKCMPDCIVLNSNSSCMIEYSYFPGEVNFDTNIDYYLKLNSYIFAMGVAAEYLYIKGNIDDAYMWDKKFKNSMFNLIRPKRNIVLPERRW